MFQVESPPRTMSLNELLTEFHTKDHFVEACRQKGKFTPPTNIFSWDFVRQVMWGEKDLIDTQATLTFDVPPRFAGKTQRSGCVITLDGTEERSASTAVLPRLLPKAQSPSILLLATLRSASFRTVRAAGELKGEKIAEREEPGVCTDRRHEEGFWRILLRQQPHTAEYLDKANEVPIRVQLRRQYWAKLHRIQSLNADWRGLSPRACGTTCLLTAN